MSDHGVAILTGKRLIDWLQIPKNLSSLPRFLQKQLELGMQMSKEMSYSDAPASIQGCIERRREWIDAYEYFIREASPEEAVPEPETLAELALAEVKYAEEMWHRNYAKAATSLQRTLEAAGHFSVNTVCWHKLWLGYALECSGDNATAQSLYSQAHAGQRNIPVYRSQVVLPIENGLPTQAVIAARQFELVGDSRVTIPQSIHKDLLYLNGTGTPKQAEEALRYLGQYLGFHSTRPDNEHGTGPDNLWILHDKSALCLDAKTDKLSTSVYRKDEFGQLSDHVQWVLANTDAKNVIPGFVGPRLAVSEAANPPAGVKLATLEQFFAVGETLKAAYRDIAATALPLTVAQVVLAEFEKRRLIWPGIMDLFGFIETLELKD